MEEIGSRGADFGPWHKQPRPGLQWDIKWSADPGYVAEPDGDSKAAREASAGLLDRGADRQG